MASDSNNTSNPWFAISMGLLGLIVGYGLSTGLHGGLALPSGGSVPAPSSAGDTVVAPPSRFASALEAFTSYATDIGLNKDAFVSCVTSNKFAQKINADETAGSAVGIDGTPGFWILGPNGKTKKISGAYPYDTFKQTFDAMLGNDPKFVSETTPPPTYDNEPMLGKANAPITVVEFTDFQCPFCGRHFTQTFGQIKTNYVDSGKVKYVIRDFPLSFHPHAQEAAEAANCANDQGKFWEMHEALFKNQDEWSALAS